MTRYRIVIIVLIALALRLAYGLAQDHDIVYANTGGDAWLYLVMGNNLVTGYDYSEISLPTAPAYLIFNGIWQNLLPGTGAIIAIRVTQAVMSTVLCIFAYRMGWHISGNEQVGLVAAAALALAPAFIIEAAQVMTETLYIFLATAGIWLYIETNQLSPTSPRRSYLLLGMVGMLLGLATLTRAVLLLFPLGLVLHLFMISSWRAVLKRAVVLLLVYILTVSTWTIHNLAHWNRFVIAAEGFASFLYIGATGWEGPTQVDENLAEDAGVDEISSENQQELYQRAATKVIERDVPGYIQHRLSELAKAYLQPHGTLFFSGESLRDLAVTWLREDRSLAGLLDLTRADAFWPKLGLYVFHSIALAFGLAGLWLTRQRWRQSLPLAGFILYTTLIHLLLYVIPRYIFPTEVFWWVFAATALVSVIRHPLRFAITDSALAEHEEQAFDRKLLESERLS